MNAPKLTLLLAGLMCLGYAQSLEKGTEVVLRFDQAISSKTAHEGDTLRFTVQNSVRSDSTVFIPAGAKVTGRIVEVDKRGRFGKNARIRIDLDPVMWNGRAIHLEPRDKGKAFSGSRTDHAAVASGAGLVLLGPIGLAAGYGFVGKSLEVKAGDTLRTEVVRL